MTVTAIGGSAADQVVTERTETGGVFRRPRVSEQQVLEAAVLMGKAFNGNRFSMLKLEEALATVDFRAAAFEVLDRELMERYQDLPQTWAAYARRTSVRDFKKKKLVDLMGGRAALDPVAELSEYPARGLSKALYEIFVTKFGGRFQISWEAMVNDELDQLSDLPGHLAAAARDTESRAAAALLTDGSGPNGSFFSATAWGRTYDETAGTWSGGSSNLIAANPALTVDSLSAALAAISQRKDPEGRPILVSGYVLVVPPALEVQANIIMNASEIEITDGAKKIKVTNWLRGKVKIVVEPWLTVLDLGANVNTTWYLLPDPGSARPALFVGFLRGHEVPDLRVKADSGQRVGGGDVPAEEGSFDVDDIQYRVRHVVGTAGTDMIATATSTGAGS